MKRLISVFLTIMMLSSMFAVFSVNTGAATSYIEAFQLGASNDEEKAKEYALTDGYSFVMTYGYEREPQHIQAGWLPYRYLSYKSTSDASKAITDLIALSDGYDSWYNEKNGCTYYCIGGYIDGVYYKQFDFNMETGGDDVYVYYTNDKRAGNPISSPQIVIDHEDYAVQNTYLRNESGDKQDLTNNALLTSDEVYLYYNQNKTVFYSELQLGADGSSVTAKSHATKNGFTLVSDQDLNDGCGISSDYEYLAYKTTTDENLAIRDMRCLVGSEFANCESWINPSNGCTYYPVGGYDDEGEWVNALDLNYDAGGENIYLYYSKDPIAGEPIYLMYIAYYDGPYDNNVKWDYRFVCYYNNYSHANVNLDNDGDCIYLQFMRNEIITTGSAFADNSPVVFIISGCVIVAGIVLGVIYTKRRKASAAV